MTSGPQLQQEAQTAYASGRLADARAAVTRALAEAPDDVDLLRLGARCAIELDTGDAAGYLRRLVSRVPLDLDAWRELGTVLMDEGDLAGAEQALRRVVDDRTQDLQALIDLGHVVYGQGRANEAVSLLAQALARQPGNLPALRALSGIHRSTGDQRSALYVATQILEWRHDDVVALIDAAELNLAIGNWHAASAAYSQLLDADAEPDHAIYAYHGMIRAEMAGGRWRRALELAVESSKLDRYDLTTQALAYAVTQVFGRGERPAPTREELEAAFADESSAHRREHLDVFAA